MSEREMIVRHAARCAFCRALLAHGRRRCDRELLDAAERLAWEHAENDAERDLFSRQARHTPGSVGAEHLDCGGQAAGTLTRDAGDEPDGLGRALGVRCRR